MRAAGSAGSWARRRERAVQQQRLGPAESGPGRPGPAPARQRCGATGRTGRLRRPVALAARMRSSTRARWRCRNSSPARSGSGWSVRNTWKRWPSWSVKRSWAPGWASSRRQIARVPGGQVCRSTQPVSSHTSAPARGWPSGSTAGVQARSGWARIASRRWASIGIPSENPTPWSRRCQASRVLAPALSLRTRTGWSAAELGSWARARSTNSIRSSAAPGAALPGRSRPASGSPGAWPRSRYASSGWNPKVCL